MEEATQYFPQNTKALVTALNHLIDKLALTMANHHNTMYNQQHMLVVITQHVGFTLKQDDTTFDAVVNDE